MSLNLIPQSLTDAATLLTATGASLDEATATAAPAMTAIPSAAADEVSTAIAALFGEQGQVFQGLLARAGQFQAQFVATMTAAASAYQAAEEANTHLVGLGQNLISIQPEGVSSSIPLDVLLHFTNSRWPVVAFVDSALLRAFYPGYALSSWMPGGWPW